MTTTTEKKEYKPVPRLNDHGSGCKGHCNWMLDCEFKTREERDIMISALDNYIVVDKLVV